MRGARRRSECAGGGAERETRTRQAEGLHEDERRRKSEKGEEEEREQVTDFVSSSTPNDFLQSSADLSIVFAFSKSNFLARRNLYVDKLVGVCVCDVTARMRQASEGSW